MTSKKIILIIGASSDIGMSFIEIYNQEYDLILAHYYHGSESFFKLKETLLNKLVLLQADLSDKNQTDNMIQEILTKGFSPSYILHFPALKCENVRFKKLTWEQFQTDLNVQFRSAVLIMQAFLPVMEKEMYGKVVFMLTSYTKGRPPKYLSNYVTVKYALLGLMKSLSSEYAEKRICINAVSPSMMETKFLEHIPDFIVEQYSQNNPMGRNLNVTDVVPMIYYLLSEESNAVTGQNILISGGE